MRKLTDPKLTHEQAVEFGRRGGCAPRRRRRQGNRAGGELVVMISCRIPLSLKKWYDRRAAELGMSTSSLIREVLQAKRNAVTGDEVKDA